MSFKDGLKRIFLGKKLASGQLGETLLPKRIALPVFASDALSSVAYAPDEIFLTLSLAGLSGYVFSWEIALIVALVMIVVVTSYRQTVHAYPSGGGDYEVATVNCGRTAGLIVASALLVDYILTVAVSISSGVQNSKAMFPWIEGHEGIIAAVIIIILMAMNLRGVKESGRFFAIPTYAFMIAVIGMTVWGLTRIYIFGEPLLAESHIYGIKAAPEYETLTGIVIVVLLMRAFSSGCAALTGVEAIANGVPALKKPKSKNAATVLALLALVAISMFAGIVTLANKMQVRIVDPHMGSHYTLNGEVVDIQHETVMGQLSKVIFNNFQPGFYFVITATMVILFLAANTAFNGFPVLSSILAKDGYLPRMLYTRGDRLAYSNGIIFLALAASGLVWVFNASVTALIQLYVVGVFVSFSISQFGMIRHWNRHLKTEKDEKAKKRMRHSRIVNCIGLSCTSMVLVIVLISKFTHGAYLAVLAMAVAFILMKLISRHYVHVEKELEPGAGDSRTLPSRVRSVIYVSAVNKPTLRALTFAKALKPNSLDAVTVSVDAAETAKVMQDWEKHNIDLPLTVLASPYREGVEPFLAYVKGMKNNNPRDVICVYIPEYVVGHWWERILHNQTTLIIKARLTLMSGVMVTSVPYRLISSERVVEKVENKAPRPAWRRSGMGNVRTGKHVVKPKS